MTSLVLPELQRALYTKLHGDGVLMGMVSGIYDTVPQKTQPPYVVIGDGNHNAIEAEGVNAAECELEIEVWADSGGRKAALLILNRIWSLLHLGTLTVTGFSTISLRCDQADTSISEEATHIRGRLIVRATTVEA